MLSMRYREYRFRMEELNARAGNLLRRNLRHDVLPPDSGAEVEMRDVKNGASRGWEWK